MIELAPKYDPNSVETRLYESWEKAGYFQAEPTGAGEPFSIVIPPPNVTGVLHVGHALNETIQDILIRWKRMEGRNALWIPGTDHAGIGTQHVVERALRKEGIDPRALGREKFLERVWKWKEQYGTTIISQLKRLGTSCDWRRTRFTMDEGLSRAVRLVFKQLYDEGLIYRDNYMVNWSPKLQTALSDDEVEYKEVQGSLWYFRYPYADGSGHAVVATTRPETMLGDTAVAVNPDDPRYKDRIGKLCILPLMNREIPIIADSFVSPEFGTGMVKVTPAHDPNDYEMGKRHSLPFINLLNTNGTLNENAGPYKGLSTEEARKRVVEDMQAAGLVEKIEPHTHSVGHDYRSGAVVEPFISKQWFVRMKPLAIPAMEAVRSGRLEIIPAMWEKTYFQWLENVRDWCISRQLWWGHRIPVFTCEDCGHVECTAEESLASCPKCGGGRVTQDPDVLDTWFSSALWPFSTMGWPEKTPTLAHFYPTSVLVTGNDIIFFWVSRMIMMGLKFMGDVPFRKAYLTPLILAESGGKMSKSKGTAIDPVSIIEQQGADAVRLTLASHESQGRTISLSMKRFTGYRDFTNKLWNAARFVLMNVQDLTAEELRAGVKEESLAVEDRWIRSHLRSACEKATAALERFQFDEYLSVLYEFTWKQYCDWYLELVKPRLYANARPDFNEASRASRRDAQVVLVTVLENLLRLLHPVAPFITEEIWLKLKEIWGGRESSAGNPSLVALGAPSIMVAPWPAAEQLGNPDVAAEEQFALLQEIVYRVRNIRGELAVPPGMKTDVEIVAPNPTRRAKIEALAPQFNSLLNVNEVRITAEPTEMALASTSIYEDVTIRVPLPAELREREAERLAKEVEKLTGEITRLQAKLSDDGFVNRAPREVVERERARLAGLEKDRANFESKLGELQRALF